METSILVTSAEGAAGTRWHANLGGGAFTSPIPLHNTSARGGSTLPSDIDADGDLDVLYLGQDADVVGWVENVRIVNASPQVGNPLPPQTVMEDEDFAIDLTGLIVDPEDGAEGVTYEIVSLSDEILFSGLGIDEEDVLILRPRLNANGSSTVTLRGSDRRGASAETTFDITVTAVNDAPTVLPIPAITANDAADPDSIDLTDYFDDVDIPEGDVLTYRIVSNSNATIFSRLEVDANSGLFEIEYADYVSGIAELVLEARDSEGLTAQTIVTVTLPELPVPQIVVASTAELNRQTGLYEQQLLVTNLAGRALGGFQLTASGLSEGASLYQGTDSSQLNYGEPIPAGETVALWVEFFVPDRAAPEATFTAEVALPSSVPLASGTDLAIDQILAQDDGSMLIEFTATPGHLYQMQYSSDGSTWHAAQGTIKAGGTRVHWIDGGAPGTTSHPSADPTRLYRVVELVSDED